MLRRKITKALLDWKKEENKPCLLIKGARQVGKTFIVDDFAKNNYKSYIYINFELQPKYKGMFVGDLDYKTLKSQLEINFSDTPIIPGDTILFLDEIQACPNARTALKGLALGKEIDVVASGSLLGLYYKEVSSYPVGYEREVELSPLDFEEYLWAIGYSDDIISNLREKYKKKEKIEDNTLKVMNEHFKNYILVGGMPNAVNSFIKNGSFQEAKKIQDSLISSYKNDILKYASTPERQKIIEVFNSIPVQLAKRNKKFMYSDISNDDEKGGERKYRNSIAWLRDAGIINYCYNLNEPAVPLAMNIKQNVFKIYMKDTGLLMSMLDSEIRKAIFDNDLYINEGGIMENIFAEEIYLKYSPLVYFDKKSHLEIDFIADIDGKSTAIEVKSGKNNQSKSLQSIIKNYPRVTRYIKFERDSNIYVDERAIEHYPLFMIMFL